VKQPILKYQSYWEREIMEKNQSDLVSLESALKTNRNLNRSRHKNFLNPGLATLLSLLDFDKQFVKAENVYVWDDKGNKYLDFLGGYGSLNLGHNHPKIRENLRQIEHMPNILQTTLNSLAGALAENLAKLTPGGLKHSFFCNSGAEAVEGALKIARIATGKKTIVYTENSFHGKTFGALSATGREKYQKPFAPLVPDFVSVPFGDTKALERTLKKESVAAFIVEPIQGEAGVILPPKGYLKQVENLCRKYQTLLIVDEVQTGLGRTGKLFAVEHEKVEPDIMILAKSLGGGVMPIGAFITTENVWRKAYGSLNTCLLHTSTFGGNTRACAAALTALEIIISDKLSEKAQKKGDYLINKLKEAAVKFPLIKEVRGLGLMIGLEFNELSNGWLNRLSGGMLGKLAKEYLASMFASELLNEYKIITAYTLNNPNVLRLEPPLTVSQADIDKVIEAINNICQRYGSMLKLTLRASKYTLRGLKA
jgi:putrescine aminotransferase